MTGLRVAGAICGRCPGATLIPRLQTQIASIDLHATRPCQILAQKTRFWVFKDPDSQTADHNFENATNPNEIHPGSVENDVDKVE